MNTSGAPAQRIRRHQSDGGIHTRGDIPELVDGESMADSRFSNENQVDSII
jgi:hypothetical protein